MKWMLLACLVGASACADRPLEPIAGSASLSDGSTVGFDGSIARVDLSFPPVIDMATGATKGIECGNALCSVTETCCPNNMPMSSWQCRQNGCGGGGNGGAGYQCDGPEDCSMGRTCVGSDRPNPGFAPLRTRCRNNPGPADIIICHVDADCGPDGFCIDSESALAGAPALRTCTFAI